MLQAIWTPQAELDLEEILFYIRVAGGRSETARRIGEELRDLAEEQAAHSRSGHKHPAAPERWRYMKYKRWLVFFEPHREGIEVMRIIDASRDLPAVFREPE
jgi:plasmid stabilization system protein ParE